tara:strand:- start:462 stop:2270 length:1809 start_codon:yes stop_codon:yes gene_type:complete
MALHDYLKGNASTPTPPGADKSWVTRNPGPYLGIVKGNTDPARMGRLRVFIPSLANTNNPSEDQLITCEYLAPFYGAKGERYTKSRGIDYQDSQHSYGMWMVPPDLETKVLVIFAEGKIEQAYWIGCVQDPYTNHMTPGIASSENTNDALDGTFEGADAGFQQDKKSKYGTTNVPSGELNRSREGALQNGNYDSLRKPIHPLAEVLLKQGLSADDIRGNTSSSARRETPSQVFGISTPGRKDTKSTKESVGTNDKVVKDYVTRGIGHTFVMDDGDIQGNNQLTRLRTASGHQLLMHDTDGVVYLANGSGKAFIEMDKDGTISVYSDGGINLRSGRDFNLHSETNINFHAKGQINFTAENNIALNAENFLFAMGEKGVFNSSQKGTISSYANAGISSFTEGQQLHGAGNQFHLQGSQVHFNKPMGRPGSGGGTSIKDWGPTWLKADAIGIKVTEGLIDIDDDTPLSSGKPNKIDNRTTVTDFVTHEPYDRQSSTARTKKFINEAMEEIKKSSPGLSATELKVIKSELLKQPSIKAVSDKLSKVVKLNDSIKLPLKNLNTLVSKANDIQSLIKDPKGAAMSFITGKIASIKSQAFSFIKSKFRF